MLVYQRVVGKKHKKPIEKPTDIPEALEPLQAYDDHVKSNVKSRNTEPRQRCMKADFAMWGYVDMVQKYSTGM